MEAPLDPLVAPTLNAGAWSPRREHAREDEYAQSEPHDDYSQEATVAAAGARARALGHDYAIGMRIQHERFGRGIVRKVEGKGDQVRVTVIFDVGGERKFLAHYAPMRPL